MQACLNITEHQIHRQFLICCAAGELKTEHWLSHLDRHLEWRLSSAQHPLLPCPAETCCLLQTPAPLAAVSLDHKQQLL